MRFRHDLSCIARQHLENSGSGRNRRANRQSSRCTDIACRVRVAKETEGKISHAHLIVHGHFTRLARRAVLDLDVKIAIVARIW